MTRRTFVVFVSNMILLVPLSKKIERFCVSKVVVWPFTDSCLEGRNQLVPANEGKEAYVRFPGEILSITVS